MGDIYMSVVGSEFQIATPNGQTQSSVTTLADGGFVVTWSSGDGDQVGVFGQRFEASGNAAGTEFQINTYTTIFQSQPSVTSLSDGGFVVTW